MSVLGKVKHFILEQRQFDGFFKEISKSYRVPVLLVRLDSLYCRFVYGSPVAQYIGFELYKMNRHERTQYITDGRTKRILQKLNAAPCEEELTFDEKPRFNRLYAKYINREWLYAPDATDEEIAAMLRRHDAVIVKPSNLTKGEGVRKLSTADALERLDEFVRNARTEKTLIEEVIVQHPEMREINPTSVNTIRVSTVRDPQGTVLIFGASLRGGGAGSVVDNLHAGGAQYPIDVETGLIIRGGVTFDGKKNLYFHPTTHKKMIGMQIPHWDQVVSTILEAAKLPKQLRYIGWDVAITEDGCELIEANCSQGCNGMQQDGVGKYRVIQRFL